VKIFILKRLLETKIAAKRLAVIFFFKISLFLDYDIYEMTLSFGHNLKTIVDIKVIRIFHYNGYW
jgi:hypothetical protein